MKVMSAGQLKGDKRNPNPRAHPKEGTKLRTVYDFFLMNRGIPVKFSVTTINNRVVEDLQNYYGLDIRNIRRGTWVLAGEWINGKYKDYIAEQLKVRG